MNTLKFMKYRQTGLTVLAVVCLLTLFSAQSLGLKPVFGTWPTAHVAKGQPLMADAAKQALIQKNYGQLPLSFEANQGQTDRRVRFLARGPGYTFFLTPTEAVMELRSADDGQASTGSAAKGLARRTPPSATLRLKLLGAQQTPRITGADELPGKSNYFLGSDARQWQTEVPNYARVKYAAVYPGIDVVYYGNQQQLEYDFIVQPGADPQRIRLELTGGRKLRLDEQGDLLIETAAGEVRQHRPVVYQEIDGRRQHVAGSYLLRGNEVAFEIGAYDASKPLVIDPVVSYSTFLTGVGGGGFGQGIVTDAAGHVYVTGAAYLSFPTSAGGLKPNLTPPSGESIANAGFFVFVAKLSPDGSSLVYSALIGGIAGQTVQTSRGPRIEHDSRGTGITLDAAGNAYVIGTTQTKDFPTTPGAIVRTFDPTPPGPSEPTKPLSFVLKLDATGRTLVYSTLLPQASLEDVAVDDLGQVCVTGGGMPGYPTTPGVFQPQSGRDPSFSHSTGDAVVAKLNPTGTAFIYSTFLGGGAGDSGWAVALDAAGNAYVTGLTHDDYIDGNLPRTTPFPVTRAPFGNIAFPARRQFVAKFNPSGGLVYSTLLDASGGDGHQTGPHIAVDASGQVYLGGFGISPEFPTTPGAFQRTFAVFGTQRTNGYVVKLTADASSLAYATFFGSGATAIYDLQVDAEGGVYLLGDNGSLSFPGAANGFRPPGTGRFVAKLDTVNNRVQSYTILSILSYPRHLAIDPQGNAYITGNASYGFPTTEGAYQRTIQSEPSADPTDVERYPHAFVMKVAPLAFTPTPTPVPTPTPTPSPIHTISGRVTTLAGQPIAGVHVNLSGAMGGDQYTGSDGSYSFTNLPPGSTYIVQASKPSTPFHPEGYAFESLSDNKTANFVTWPTVQALTNLSAASYADHLAPDSIVTAFGINLATTIQVATSNPLPTSLAGTSVKVRDALGGERQAPLFFVSPTQVNYLVPPGTAPGLAIISITSGNGATSSALAEVEPVAPGLFTADASGRGLAAAVALRIKAGGTQSYEPVARFDATQNRIVAAPIDLGPDLGAASDQVFLIFYGTGFRHRSGMNAVTARIGGTSGVAAPVIFAGEQGGFAGLDQANVLLPRALIGRGEVNVQLGVDGRAANVVKVWIR